MSNIPKVLHLLVAWRAALQDRATDGLTALATQGAPAQDFLSPPPGLRLKLAAEAGKFEVKISGGQLAANGTHWRDSLLHSAGNAKAAVRNGEMNLGV